MSEIKLLPCPFCSGEAELLKGLCELDNYVMCLKCRAKTKFYNTKSAAIKGWNTRKPIECIMERLEEYKADCKEDWDEYGNEDGFGEYVACGHAIDIIEEESGVKDAISSNLA